MQPGDPGPSAGAASAYRDECAVPPVHLMPAPAPPARLAHGDAAATRGSPGRRAR